MSALGNQADGTREGLFSPSPVLKRPYSCADSSSIQVHSRGLNFHSGAATRFVNQFPSSPPPCGPASISVPLYFQKNFIRIGSLVLPIWILNAKPRGRWRETEVIWGRQVDTRDAAQLSLSEFYTASGLFLGQIIRHFESFQLLNANPAHVFIPCAKSHLAVTHGREWILLNPILKKNKRFLLLFFLKVALKSALNMKFGRHFCHE